MTRLIEIDGDIALVPLTQGKVAVIDADLAPVIGRWNWHAQKAPGGLWYASRTDGKAAHRNRLLHREIMGAQPGQIVDHADGDGLNCRRKNMRFSTHQENARNSTSRRVGLPKGVVAYGGGYGAVIGLDGGRYHVGGWCETAEEAAAIYEAFARAIFKEFYRNDKNG